MTQTEVELNTDQKRTFDEEFETAVQADEPENVVRAALTCDPTSCTTNSETDSC